MTQVSIAMSSTGFKFPAHIGVLEALETAGLDIVEMSGSSGGALISGLYACGIPVDRLKEWALKTSWIDFFKFHPSAWTAGGLVSLEEFAKHIDKMMYGAKLGDLDIDLHIAACDLTTHSQVVLSKHTFPEMKVSDAVCASISIPVLFTPIRYGNMVLSDGAIMNTMPANLLLRQDVTRMAARVTYEDIHQVGDVHAPWWVAKRALYMLVDRGNAWAVRHHAATEGIAMVDIDTGFTDGMNFVMPEITRRKLIDAGRVSIASFLAKKEGP